MRRASALFQSVNQNSSAHLVVIVIMVIRCCHDEHVANALLLPRPPQWVLSVMATSMSRTRVSVSFGGS